MNEENKKYIEVCNAIYTLVDHKLVDTDKADFILLSISTDKQELKKDFTLEITKTRV